MHNNMVPNLVELELRFSCTYDFNGFLITKKVKKIGILEIGFWPFFPKKFQCGTIKLGLKALSLLSGVCEWPLWTEFSGPF